MALETGKQLGPYIIVSQIGSGGMGQVYRARDRRLERDVAVKVLPDELSQDPDVLARFEREARVLAAVSHPNILTVFDVGREGDTFYVVTELLEGATLREKMSRAPLPWKLALELSIAIAEGLSAAHSRGITHRDLKPENVFITLEGHVKILDFGLARGLPLINPEHSTDTQPGTIIGTVEYMAPEQVRGEGVDARSDIFSFGGLLYEMVIGKRPFTRRTAADTMAAILKEEVHSVAENGIPLELDRLILHCLEKNPEQRFQSARDLAFDLRSVWHDSGILRTAAVPDAHQTRRIPLIIFVALLALAAAFVAYRLSTKSTEAIESIAVLPFENASADPNAEYLCDGITEGIINSLSRSRDLKVMARSTVFRYKNDRIDPQEAGRTLKVRAILAGRVLQQQEQIVIKAELVNVKDGAQLWGDSYSRNMADIQAVQEEISRKISDSLRLTIRDEAPAHTSGSGEAYQAYLKGRYYWNKRTGEDLKRAIAEFQKASDHDPGFALAYAGLADSYNLLSDYAGIPPDKAYPLAEAAARKALELDEGLAEAHVSLAQVLSVYDWNWAEAEKQFRRGIELSPNYATGHHWLGWHLAMQGRHEEALSEIRKAQDLDPLSHIIQSNVALFLFFARDYSAAVDQCRSILKVDPDVALAHYYLGLALEQQGSLQDAESELKSALQHGSDGAGTLSALARCYVRLGKKTEADGLIRRLQENSQNQYLSPVYFARVHAAMGDTSRTLESLEQGFQLRDELMIWLKVDPRFDFLLKDPRFLDLLQRIRFPE